jgi:hypothetical protein
MQSDFRFLRVRNTQYYNSFLILAISSLRPAPTAPIPIAVAVFLFTLPFLLGVHPIQLMTFLANISPNPSMTPLMNGKKKLIAIAEESAKRRVRVDRDELNIVRVAEGG